jgi:hypothetical protein
VCGVVMFALLKRDVPHLCTHPKYAPQFHLCLRTRVQSECVATIEHGALYHDDVCKSNPLRSPPQQQRSDPPSRHSQRFADLGVTHATFSHGSDARHKRSVALC